MALAKGEAAKQAQGAMEREAKLYGNIMKYPTFAAYLANERGAKDAAFNALWSRTQDTALAPYYARPDFAQARQADIMKRAKARPTGNDLNAISRQSGNEQAWIAEFARTGKIPQNAMSAASIWGDGGRNTPADVLGPLIGGPLTVNTGTGRTSYNIDQGLKDYNRNLAQPLYRKEQFDSKDPAGIIAMLNSTMGSTARGGQNSAAFADLLPQFRSVYNGIHGDWFKGNGLGDIETAWSAIRADPNKYIAMTEKSIQENFDKQLKQEDKGLMHDLVAGLLPGLVLSGFTAPLTAGLQSAAGSALGLSSGATSALSGLQQAFSIGSKVAGIVGNRGTGGTVQLPRVATPAATTIGGRNPVATASQTPRLAPGAGSMRIGGTGGQTGIGPASSTLLTGVTGVTGQRVGRGILLGM